ncbi:hypothetical protein [Clostridium transplantifaecale]|uniref:hypothetical protein n=1 Tax=Clostridium transplantifaecale TaxID=2479838 RepID=UPI0019D06EEE
MDDEFGEVKAEEAKAGRYGCGCELIDRQPELPIFYNVNFGHAKPIAIIPYGIEAELNCENKTIRFLESPTI